MGIDINALRGQLSGSVGSEQPPTNSMNYPRGTQFDELGNPIQESFKKEERNY